PARAIWPRRSSPTRNSASSCARNWASTPRPSCEPSTPSCSSTEALDRQTLRGRRAADSATSEASAPDGSWSSSLSGLAGGPAPCRLRLGAGTSAVARHLARIQRKRFELDLRRVACACAVAARGRTEAALESLREGCVARVAGAAGDLVQRQTPGLE